MRRRWKMAPRYAGDLMLVVMLAAAGSVLHIPSQAADPRYITAFHNDVNVSPVPHRFTEWNTKDWFRSRRERKIELMTITYPSGTIVQAVLRSRSQDELRVTVTGRDDVLVFTRIHGAWISEEIEPVTIALTGQRGGKCHDAEDDRVSSKEVPGRMMATLFGDRAPSEVVAKTLYLSCLV